MPNIGPIEIIVVILILLVIFGPKRIPELGKSVGQGMRNFKQSVTGKERDDEPGEIESSPRRAAPATETRAEGPYDAEPVAASARREPAPAIAPGESPTPDRTREPGL